MMDITFDKPEWETALEGIAPGSSLSAARFLAWMEPCGEEEFGDALELLDSRDVLLDISDLPEGSAGGQLQLRLRREAELVKTGKLPEGLEENDPLRLYLEELAGTPVCGDVSVLAQQLLAGDQDAAGKLTALLLSEVIQSAFALAGKGVLLMDLIQEGSLGLWQAIMAYEGGDMEQHCRRGIRRVMNKTLTVQARESGVGRKLQQAMADYQDVDQRLLGELGRNPTLEEIAQQLHMTCEETAAVKEMLDSARMLNRAKAEEPGTETEEEERAVEDTAYFQMRQRIAELLEAVTEGEAALLKLRFGLEGGKPLSPEETGARLGMTPGEVVAMEAAALAKLRNSL